MSRYLTGTFTAYRARFYVGFLSCIVDDYFVFFYDSAIIFHGFGSDTSFLFRDRETFYGIIYIKRPLPDHTLTEVLNFNFRYSTPVKKQ